MVILARVVFGLLGVTILAGYATAIFLEGRLPSLSDGYYDPIVLPLLLYFAIACVSFGIRGQRLLARLIPGAPALQNHWHAKRDGQDLVLPTSATKVDQTSPPKLTASRLAQLTFLAMVLLFLFFGKILSAWEDADAFLHERFGGKNTPEPAEALRSSSVSAMQAGALKSLADRVKPVIVDFYQGNSRLPRSRDIGPLPPDARLLENGTLEVAVDRDPGATAYWRLLPTANSGNVAWECVTPNIGNLSNHLPDCRYDPTFEKNAPIFQDSLVSDHLYFQPGRSDGEGLVLGEQARFEQILRDIAPTASNRVIDIQVAGYADPTGSEDVNDRLAEARALFVRESLVGAGIGRPLIGMRTIGVDPAAPLDCLQSNRRGERVKCLAKSRRVDLVVKMQRTL